MQAKQSKRLKVHAILGTKGGVGKSTLAVHLSDWFKRNKISYLAFDLDEENSTFNRFAPEAVCLNTRDREQADELIIKAEEVSEKGDAAAIIMDLRAGSGDEMLTWFSEVPFEYLSSKGIDFVGWGCVTSDPDSQQTVARWMDRLGHALAAAVFVKNLKDGNFSFQKPLNCPKITHEITIPQIEARLMARINEQALRLSDILNIEETIKGLTDTMMKARIRRIQQEVFASFDSIASTLSDAKQTK